MAVFPHMNYSFLVYIVKAVFTQNTFPVGFTQNSGYKAKKLSWTPIFQTLLEDLQQPRSKTVPDPPGRLPAQPGLGNLLWQGGQTRWSLEVSFNPYNPVILWYLRMGWLYP